MPHIETSKLMVLIEGCRRQHPPAQTAFYQLYKRRFAGVCMRYAHTTLEADDIFQDAFVKVFQQIGELQDVQKVDKWVKSIIIRTAIDYYRRNKKLREMEDLAGELMATADLDVEMLAQFGQAKLLSLIQQLADGYRLIVNLYLIDGYEHHEIAEMLGISVGTSKSQLSRAKQQLRNLISAIEIHEYPQR